MEGLSRSFLKALGCSDEQISAIAERHTEVTGSIKTERDGWKEKYEAAKAEADKVPNLQKELDELKGGEDYKSKYEQAVKEHDDYVKGVEAKETAAKVRTAYGKLLADEQIKADRIDFVLGHTDLSKMKLDKDGNLADADTLKKSIGDEWGFFKVTTKERKAAVATPPAEGTGTGVSRAKELAQKYNAERYGVKPDTGKE